MKRQEIQAFYEKVYTSYSASIDEKSFDQYERNTVLKRLYSVSHGKFLLDIGAGNGTVSRFFLSKGYEVHAVEWTKAGVEKLIEAGVHALQQDIEDIPYHYPDNYFDEVFWGDNIEHLFFPEKVAQEIHRILKPGGRLVLSTPNHGWIINRFYYLFMGLPRRTEGHRLPIWEWQHIRYFNGREIRRFLNHCGFQHGFKLHSAERRQPFTFLSRYWPETMGSVIIVEVLKG